MSCHRLISSGKLADPLSGICNTYPHGLLVSCSGCIEHLIKHTLWGSNVTILGQALSIPPWPFFVFTFVGHRPWWLCGKKMEGKQKSLGEQEGAQRALHCRHAEQQKLSCLGRDIPSRTFCKANRIFFFCKNKYIMKRDVTNTNAQKCF